MKPIGERFAWEHQRISGTLGELDHRIHECGGASVLDTFTRFSRALREHLRLEEDVLFPLVEQEFLGPRAMVESLRREHEPMRLLLADIERGLSNAGYGGILANLHELQRALDLHCAKARKELYPVVDELVRTHPDLASRLDPSAVH